MWQGLADDTTLLREYARTRDADAFAELVRRYAGMVYGVCLRGTGSHYAEYGSCIRPRGWRMSRQRMIDCVSLAALLALLSAGCQGRRKTGEPAPAQKEAGPGKGARPQIERDLRLEVKLESRKTIEPGEEILVEAALTNTSQELAHRVVKPGDGSCKGWREPHVFFTAEIDHGDGKWEPVPKQQVTVADAEFDDDWQKDIVEIGPGERLPLPDYLPLPEYVLELQEPGRVRLYLHYAYRAGRADEGEAEAAEPVDPGAMKDTPPFEIVSPPVELTLVRPLDVVVEAKAPLMVGRKTRLSSFLSAFLVNRSDREIKVSSPRFGGGNELVFEIQVGDEPHRRSMSEQRSHYGIEKKLKPGERVPLLGRGDFSNDMDGTWSCPAAGRFPLRGVYYRRDAEPDTEIKSKWTELEVYGRDRVGPGFPAAAPAVAWGGGKEMNGLRCRIMSPQKTFRVGRALRLKAEFQNTSRKRMLFCRKATRGKSLWLHISGPFPATFGTVERTWEVASVPEPSKEDYVWLEPGGTVGVLLTGLRDYELTRPGQYSVALGWRNFRVRGWASGYYDGAGEDRKWVEAPAWEGELISNTIMVDVVKGDAPPAPEAVWGEAVGGLKCRLRADRRVWAADEVPTLKADVWNTGNRELYVPRAQALCELQVDEVWYRWAGEIRVKSDWLSRRCGYRDVRVTLETTRTQWTPVGPTGVDTLHLTPGRHVVRVAFTGRIAGRRGKPIRAVSKPVEIEIGPEAATAAVKDEWGPAISGVRARLVADRTTVKAGELPELAVVIENNSDRHVYFEQGGGKIPIFRHAALWDYGERAKEIERLRADPGPHPASPFGPSREGIAPRHRVRLDVVDRGTLAFVLRKTGRHKLIAVTTFYTTPAEQWNLTSNVIEITAEGAAAPAADTRAESASEKRLVQARELLKVLDKAHNSTMPRAVYYGLHKKRLQPLMPEALDVLIGKLESPNWDTRWDAQDLLAELGGTQHRDKIAKPLVGLLGDENRHVRSRSFHLLSKIEERRALGILIEMSAVRDATKFEREHINSILCELAGKRRAPRSWQDWWEEKGARYARPPDDWQEVVKSARERWRHEAGADGR